MSLSLSDGFWFEMGRVLVGVSIVAAVLAIALAWAVIKHYLEVAKDRRDRKAGCVICHKKAEFYQSYNGRKGYVCRHHTLAPADHAHGYSVPLN